MYETLLLLLVAHLVADFPLQPDWMIRRKRHPAMLVLHGLVVVGTAALALGGWPVTVLLILVGTHLAMDAVKVYALGNSLGSFILDQAVHLAVIVALAAAYPGTFAQGAWATLPGNLTAAYLVGLCLLGGTIASLMTGAIVIRKATEPFTHQLSGDIAGLESGGAYIGWLERALVMLLILIGQPAGVGFLITAKSILRFGDVRDSSQRKLTEYIIIGTFMSFGWGLAIAALTQLAMRHWMERLQ
jgi:TM2 domain-containing membrane protein YozV